MRKLFETSKTELNTDEKSSALLVKFNAMHTEKIKKLNNIIDLPGIDECSFLWTLNSFNAFTFIPFCIAKFGVIDELYISTYTVSKKIADSLALEMDKSNIKKINLFVADSLKFRMPKVVEHLETLRLTRDININYTWNHSKICCVKCADNYLVLEGSGNFSENAQYEQYLLINSKNVYEFRKSNISMV